MVMVHTFTYPTVMYQNTFVYLYMLRDGPLCFDGAGEGGGILTCKNFLIYGSCCKQFFLCRRLPLNTLFFTCIKFISVFIASANDLLQNFPTPSPPPLPVKKY